MELRQLQNSAYVCREHLDRCHRVFQCPCCYLAFLKKEKLKAHLDSPSACSPRSNIHVFGLNEEKLKLVREKLQSKTPEEMWRELYRRIFPEISPESVPSPCEFRMMSSVLVLFINVPLSQILMGKHQKRSMMDIIPTLQMQKNSTKN
jgi:hypothetical protein